MAGFQEVPLHLVEPSPYQPRKEIDPAQLAELAESIRAEGLLQPIVVRPAGGKFQLIAGERRWRAFQQLKLKSIPARVLDASDASSATLTLIENLQREGLNPIDEAYGYASLIRDFDLTQEQAAERVGKGRASVANSLRLLSLE
ncbi:MAG TPA: ParB/RepB/Spo0J family partition protein, partial [Opitutaceae bacterium]|nr:ParB/RepB/Spo0J family partition protein [Opitutaceae bacterium]